MWSKHGQMPRYGRHSFNVLLHGFSSLDIVSRCVSACRRNPKLVIRFRERGPCQSPGNLPNGNVQPLTLCVSDPIQALHNMNTLIVQELSRIAQMIDGC